MDKTPFNYSNNKQPALDQILNLYEDAGWASYTKDPEQLQQAIKQSAHVLTCYHGETLVGLLRAVSDETTILYIQDILVLKAYKRKGIGRELMLQTIEAYSHVRQLVLLTDETPETRGFYNSLGLQSCDDGKLVAFAKFNLNQQIEA